MSAVGPLFNATVAVGLDADDFHDNDDDNDDDDDGAVPLPPTISQCQIASMAGCCFPSLLAYSFGAVTASYLQGKQVAFIQTFGSECMSLYGIKLMMKPCAGTVNSTCQNILAVLSPDCMNFMVDLNNEVRTIGNNQTQNQQLCSHPCYHNVSTALYSLIINGLRLT
jgi:hypothetical protein